jgi:hypothetical protein
MSDRKVRFPMNPLNAYLALEIMNDRVESAARYRRAGHDLAPVPRYDAVTVRRTTPDDWTALERLAQLEGRRSLEGPALVAEVDERILAARSLDHGGTLADPFHPTAELVALLDARARQLGARPAFVLHPLRRTAMVIRRRRAAHS